MNPKNSVRAKLGNRTAYFGNSGNVRVTGRRTNIDAEFSKSEKRELVQIVIENNHAYENSYRKVEADQYWRDYWGF